MSNEIEVNIVDDAGARGRDQFVEVTAAGVSSFNARKGAVTLTEADVEAVLPASTARIYNTIYLVDYGSGVGTGGDDTAAFIAAIAAAETLAGAQEIAFAMKIVLPPVLSLNSAPITTSHGNAIVPLPDFGSSIAYLEIEGAPGGTTIFTSQSGLSYSSSHGPPSVIGGPTTEQLGENFNFGPFVKMSRVTVIPTSANPTISGFDFSRVDGVDLDDVYAVGSEYDITSAPTHFTFGIRLPEGGNGSNVKIGTIGAFAYYAGVVANTAHVVAKSILLNYCVVGLAVTGDTQYNSTLADQHSSVIDYLLTQECTNHIASWSPTAGVISIPAGHQARLNIGLWDVEYGPSGPWYFVANTLLDANSQIYGSAKWWGVNAGGYPVVTGGTHFLIDPLGNPVGNRAAITLERIAAVVTQSATPAIDTDNCTLAIITGLAQAITSMTTNLTGTPWDYQPLTIRITDNGTGRAITWGAGFEASSVALPTTTVAGVMLSCGFFFNPATGKFRLDWKA